MGTTKISALTEQTAPSEDDVLAIVSSGVTKKAQIEKILTTQHPSTVTYEDLKFPILSAKLGGVNDPDLVQVKDDGSGSTGVFAYAFDKTTEEEAFFLAQMPHAWKEGSKLDVHVHWMPTDTGTGDVVWGLEYTVAEIDGVFSDTTIIEATVTAGGVAYTHTVTDLGDIAMTGKTISTMLLGRVFRKAGDAGDTYDADAILLDIDFHYQIDSLGSSEEYTK